MAERFYQVSHHARERLAERYGVKLTDETWDTLVRTTEDQDREQVGTLGRRSMPTYRTDVRLQGPDGSALVVPMVYTAGRWRVEILTVMPGGFRLGRHG